MSIDNQVGLVLKELGFESKKQLARLAYKEASRKKAPKFEQSWNPLTHLKKIGVKLSDLGYSIASSYLEYKTVEEIADAHGIKPEDVDWVLDAIWEKSDQKFFPGMDQCGRNYCRSHLIYTRKDLVKYLHKMSLNRGTVEEQYHTRKKTISALFSYLSLPDPVKTRQKLCPHCGKPISKYTV